MHPHYGALPLPHVSVLVTRSGLVAHWNMHAPPRCKVSPYRRTFIPLSASVWNDLADSVFDGVRLAGFKSRLSDYLLVLAVNPFFSSNIFPFLFFSPLVGIV